MESLSGYDISYLTEVGLTMNSKTMFHIIFSSFLLSLLTSIQVIKSCVILDNSITENKPLKVIKLNCFNSVL